jgi:hypothetical protein
MTAPVRCVIDTNVMTTANRANAGASEACVVASAKALQAVMAAGHIFIDDGGRIVAEYRGNLNARGQPGPGDAFFKWLLTHEWVRILCVGGKLIDFARLVSEPLSGSVASG